ncbi:MAG: hypothetical protein R2774_00780 [Saprospiraceae bacterium]
MRILIIFISLIISTNHLQSQIFPSTGYFTNCNESYKMFGDTCFDFQMRKFIEEKIINTLPEKEIMDKKNLKLHLIIDSTSSITHTFLTWGENYKYHKKDIKVPIKKIKDYITKKEVIAHYTFPTEKKAASIYCSSEMIFKVVEVMPSFDSCYFESKQKTNCAYTTLFNAMNTHIKSMNKQNWKEFSGKVVFGMIIKSSGYIGECQIYKNLAGNNADSTILLALEKVKKDKMQFMPGFQRNQPADVLVTVEYDFATLKN